MVPSVTLIAKTLLLVCAVLFAPVHPAAPVLRLPPKITSPENCALNAALEYCHSWAETAAWIPLAFALRFPVQFCVPLAESREYTYPL